MANSSGPFPARSSGVARDARHLLRCGSGPPLPDPLWREAIETRNVRLALTDFGVRTIFGKLPAPSERLR